MHNIHPNIWPISQITNLVRGMNRLPKLYSRYTQSWTHCSKYSLGHGPYFHRYSCRNIWKCVQFERLLELLNSHREIDLNFVETQGSVLFEQPLYWPIASLAIVYMEPTSTEMLVEMIENVQGSNDWHTTFTTESRQLISILW